MKFFLKKYYPLLLILITASALRINLLLVRGTFWFDEIFSFHFSQLPWAQALKYWTIETNPPLHTLFIRGWIGLFHTQNEILLRLPSVIFGLLAIIFLYLLAEKMFNRFTASISALFLALSGIHIFTATEARVYPLLTFLTILSFYFFYSLYFLKENNKTKQWLYFVTNLLLIFSHLTALPIFLIQALILFLIKPEQKKIKQWWIAQLTIGAIWLVWFIPSIIAKIDPASLTAWYFDTSAKQFADIFTLLVSNFVNVNFSSFIFTLISIGIVTTIFSTISIICKNPNQDEKNKLTFICLWGLLPIIFGSFLGVFITKYYVTASLGIYLIVGSAIARITQTKKTKFLAIIIAIILMADTAISIGTTPIFSWHYYLNYIKKQETENSIIMVNPFNEELAIKHYYQGKTPVKGIYYKNDNLPFDERVVRYNWNKQITSKEELKKWFDENLINKDTLFYFQYTEEYDWSHQILLAKGWQITKTLVYPGLINLYMFEFHAPNYTTTSTLGTTKNK